VGQTSSLPVHGTSGSVPLQHAHLSLHCNGNRQGSLDTDPSICSTHNVIRINIFGSPVNTVCTPAGPLHLIGPARKPTRLRPGDSAQRAPSRAPLGIWHLVFVHSRRPIVHPVPANPAALCSLMAGVKQVISHENDAVSPCNPAFSGQFPSTNFFAQNTSAFQISNFEFQPFTLNPLKI
jgi:hypothetical protein